MAVRTISVPDEVDAAYVKHNPQNPARAMAKQLERFAVYSPQDRPLVLPVDVIREIEKIAMKNFETPEALLRWITTLVTVDVEGTQVALTPYQRVLLKQRADFFAKPYAEYAATTIQNAIRASIGA